MTESREDTTPEPAKPDSQENHGEEANDSLLPAADPAATTGSKWSRDEGDRVEHADGT